MTTLQTTRRAFLRYVAAAGGAVGLGSLAAACAPSATGPAVSAPSGTGTAQPAAGGTLTVGMQFPVQLADPHNYKGNGDFAIFANVYDRLVELDVATLKPQPSLATSWRALDDTTWEIKLRKDVKFSDGTPFDASAAKLNLERAATGTGSSPFGGIIASVQAVDAETIILKTKTAYSQTIFNLGQFPMSVVAPSSIAKGKDFLSTNGIGTGPFVIKEWVAGDRFVLERNPTYWKTPAKLDKIVLRTIQNENTRLAALQAGDVDLVDNPPAATVKQLAGDARFQVNKLPIARTYFIMYQLQDPIMKNVKVRQAIAAAINRKAIVEQVTEGLQRPANGFLPPEALDGAGSDPGFQIEYSPDKARQLLKDSGVDLSTLRLKMLPERSIVSADAVALAIQEDLKKVGLNVDIVQLESAALQERYKSYDYQLGPQSWGLPDPDTSLRKVFSARGPWRFPNKQDPAFEAKLDEASATLDDAKRLAIYKGIFRDMLEQAEYLPIVHTVIVLASNKKVKGVNWSPINAPYLVNTSLSG